MDRHRGEPREIQKPKLLLVEGKDEVQLFGSLLEREGLSETAVEKFGGTTKLLGALRTLNIRPGYERLRSLAVVRDADRDASAAFQSVCTALDKAGLPTPKAPLQTVEGKPRVGVMVLPPGKPCGMLEDVCLMSVAEDPAMACVDEFFTCLMKNLDRLPRNASKSMVRAFLVSRELLEESHFEFIRQCLEQWIPSMPKGPSVEKVHAFLASRYNPRLDLGRASEPDPPYWNFEHPAFDEVKRFLRSL